MYTVDLHAYYTKLNIPDIQISEAHKERRYEWEKTMEGQYDDLFLGLAQRHSGIEDLLETFLSFLERKTDFFHVMTQSTEKMGFPPGVSETMMLKVFKKYQKKYEKRMQPDLTDKLKVRYALLLSFKLSLDIGVLCCSL